MRMLLAVIATITLALSLALTLVPRGAGAGISPQGYAQTAQTALQKAGGFYGYRVTCTGRYSNQFTAQVKIVCVMNETAP